MAKIKEKSEQEDKLALLEIKYGKGSIVRASNTEHVKEYTGTGSLTLDLAIGSGKGVPKEGKITHIVGQPSASKTTLSLHIIAEEQKKNKEIECAFLDIEGTLMLDYAESLGCDLSRLWLVDVKSLLKKKKPEDIQGVSGEEWLDILCDLISTNRFGIIVLDSIAELCPMMELQAGQTQGSIAGIGRMMSKSLRSITARLLPTNTGLVMLNQYRMSPGKYGNPYIEAAGEAMRYYTALKIELSAAPAKDDGEIVGLDVKAKVTKSKIGNPFGEGNYYVLFGKGIQRVNEILILAEELAILTKTGSWYVDGETKMENGYDKMLEFLKTNPEYTQELECRVLEALKQTTETKVV